MTDFANLMRPGRIGSLELRNRILMAPMGDSLANDDGTVSSAQLAYFEARARGGAALLLVGSVAVAYPDGCVDARQVAASRDSDIDGLRALADRVHQRGACIAAQLTYNGALARYDIARGHPMLVPAVPKRSRPDRLSMMVTDAEVAGFMAPHASPTAKVEYRVASDDDLALVVKHFVDASDRCRRAGIDGVELHAGHGYLIDEFLSPSINTREDQWGGPIEHRARLLVTIIRAIRARVGDDYPLWMRINALEYHKADGETFDDQLAVIELAVAAGLDAVHVTAYANLDAATGPTDSYAPHRVGDLATYAAAVKGRVDVPVITFGRFEPAEAEAVLADGRADFIAMGRKLLADPDLPNKLRTGDVDRVRPCLYQYRCIGNIFVNESLACVANAATGREHEAAVPAPRRAQRVLIVGGGAAGLECARVLAEQGHVVEIRDRSVTLGGVLENVRGADAVLDRQREWLTSEVDRAAVKLTLGHEFGVADIPNLNVDAVVVATGAHWVGLTVAGHESAHVLAPTDLGGFFAGDDDAVSDPVVVLGGGKPGLTLAAALRVRGRSVTIVEPTRVFGTELGLPGRFRWVADAEAAGITLLGSTRLVAITRDHVVVESDGAESAVPAGTVVVATRESRPSPFLEPLTAANIATFVVGDAADPRGFEGITRDAEHVARALADAE